MAIVHGVKSSQKHDEKEYVSAMAFFIFLLMLFFSVGARFIASVIYHPVIFLAMYFA